MNNEYIQFLIPHSTLEQIFFWGIIILTLGTLLSLFIYANDKYWEKAWENDTLTEDDDLDAEHGSVYDLSDAVATKPENLAIVLPGVLLVLGLLGTFLGVGVALNNATEVLSSQNSDSSEMINRMLPMLKGMGLTFKTSIYGVIAFLVFKLVHGSLGIEKKRIVWVIKKSKPQIDKRNEKLHIIEEKRHNGLVHEITNITSTLREEFKKSIEVGTNNFNALLAEQTKQNELNNRHFDTFVSSFQTQGENFTKLLSTEFLETRSNAINGFQELSNSFSKELINHQKSQMSFYSNQHNELIFAIDSQIGSLSKVIESKSLETRATIDKNFQGLTSITQEGVKTTSKVVQSMGEVVKNLGDSSDEFGHQMLKTSKEMDKATEKIAKSSEELKKSIDEFGPMVNKSLESIRTNFVNSIEKSSSKMSLEMTNAAATISSGVDKMSKSNADGQQRLKESLESSEKQIAKISTAILTSSEDLSTASVTTEKTISELGDKIADNLKSISTSNLHMSTNSKKVDATLESNTKILIETKGEIIKYFSHLEKGLSSMSKSMETSHKSLYDSSEKFNSAISSNSQILNNGKKDLADFSKNINKHFEQLVASSSRIFDSFEKLNKTPILKTNHHNGGH
ncbi:MAG: hypothetical protein COW71_13090 [Ignavibacteriales bacterium CG18_big_fil_WC_8_21_14_2_50_31_20]|nr:MAG: hypothetical protein COW71_13090 [Ignavibacteriales bacterium CG18_big_fil_WC_8_21_14_2_50_31_20]